MKNLLISFAFTLFSPLLMAADSVDSLKKPNLTYHSDFEKNKFEAYIVGKQFDTIGFLLAIDSSMTKTDAHQAVNDLSSFYKTIDTEGDKKKKNLKKFVDFLFTNIHAQFLKKYEENVVFNRIFQDGVYNCITASALYALVFEHYGIPYRIKELPTHIYIVVDPEGLSIMIETTDPKGGYFAPSDKFKKNFVNELIESKVVTQTEVNTEGGQAIFEKHYYDNQNAHITMTQLVALLYYNKALALNDVEKNKAAFFELEKAYHLYPSDRIKSVLLLNLSAELRKIDDHYDNIENVKFYTKIFDYLEIATLRKAIATDFEHMSNEFLINNNKPDYYEQLYNILETAISDSATLSDIHFIYYAKKGQVAFLNAKYKPAVDFTAKCLTINPNNVPMKTIFVNSIIQSFGHRRDYDKIIDELYVYGNQYPFLFESDTYSRAIGHTLMGICANKCYNDEYSESLPYFERFEKLMTEHPVTYDSDMVGGAYGEASSYCIRKLIDYEKARDWLNRGMKYDPNSQTLKRKMKTLDENPEPSKSKVSTEEIKVFELSNPNFKVLSKPPPPKKKKG